MPRIVILGLLLALVAGPAAAVVDPDPDCVGIYFDPEADVNCTTATPYATVPLYLILTNPSMAAIGGFSAGCDLTGAAMVLGITIPGFTSIIDFPDFHNLIIGYGAPRACTEATVLVITSVLYMDTSGSPIEFRLRDSIPSSLDPAYPTLLLTDETLVSTGLSTPPGTACAVINGECVVAAEAASWDGIKSLYR